MRTFASNAVSSICRRASHFKSQSLQIATATRLIGVERSDRCVISTFDIGAVSSYVLSDDQFCEQKKGAMMTLNEVLDCRARKQLKSCELAGGGESLFDAVRR